MNRDPNNEIFIEDKSENACKEQTLMSASSVFDTCKNLEKIKESIRDIRNEGIVVHLEVQKLKQQLEYGSSCRESSRSKRSLMDIEEPSKELSNLGIQNEILELKNQVLCLNQRLCKGEELIKSKAVENYSLQFQAFNLTKKLQKIRSKRDVMENTKCSICEIF
jgi:regulator of replication initiation timing